jgi:hypothetical protein
MTEPFSTRVLADSVSREHRLITVEVTFPRYLLAEFNTHRRFSRNSASSRAIPPEKQLMRIRNEPFIPRVFYGRAKGMGQAAPLDKRQHGIAENAWLRARDEVVRQALSLITAPGYVNQWEIETVIQKIAEEPEGREGWLNVSKSTVNRLLEPFMWHTVIVTATEWDNFFALRCPPGDEVDEEFPAEPEIQRTALAMREAMRASEPNPMPLGQWHLPLVMEVEKTQIINAEDAEKAWEYWAMVSAGRCARVSFDTHENYEAPEASYARAERLLSNGHLSPFEHAATPLQPDQYGPDWQEDGTISNFDGWLQFRKTIPGEYNRVGQLEERPPWDA